MLTLEELYTNSPAAYSTAARLYAHVRKLKLPYTRIETERFLTSLKSFNDNRKRYYKQDKAAKIIAYGPMDLHSMDLMFLPRRRNFIGVLVM